MKKKWIIVLLIIIILVIIIILNIYNYNSRLIQCTYNSKNDLYDIKTKYLIKHKKDKVINLYTEEVITSTDEKMLSDYKFSLETVYNKYNKLKYYDNAIILKDNTLTVKTNINYEKINIDNFIDIDNNIKKLLNKGNISVKKLKQTYKNNGAKCIYK